jgi:hypothetical protein
MQPIAPSVMEAADFVYETSLSHQHVYELVSSLSVDVLVFADTMSEPMTHFMAHSRLAKVQVFSTAVHCFLLYCAITVDAASMPIICCTQY